LYFSLGCVAGKAFLDVIAILMNLQIKD
jgi:hypothetical protein